MDMDEQPTFEYHPNTGWTKYNRSYSEIDAARCKERRLNPNNTNIYKFAMETEAGRKAAKEQEDATKK